MVCLDNMNKKSELLSSGVSLSCSEYWCIIFQCAPRMIRTGLQHGLQTSLLHSYILPLHTLHRIQQQFSPRPEKNCKQNCCFLSISREDTIACFNLGDKPVWYDRIEFFLAMACCPVYGARSSCFLLLSHCYFSTYFCARSEMHLWSGRLFLRYNSFFFFPLLSFLHTSSKSCLAAESTCQ